MGLPRINASVCAKCVQIRRFATGTNKNASTGLPKWPQGENPPPKDIFGISSVTPDFDQKLKSTYQKYVKIYHPDVNKEIYDSNGNILSAEVKRQRFDQILSAYEILKNPQKRHIYWRYENSGTKYQPRTPMSAQLQSFDNFRSERLKYKPSAYNASDPFWQAATWEDFYKMKYKMDPPTAEEQAKTKRQILAAVLSIAVLSMVLQVMLAMRRAEEFRDRMSEQTSNAAQYLINNDTRDDLPDDSRLGRLQKFFILRRFNSFDHGNLEEHENMKRDEERIMKRLN